MLAQPTLGHCSVEKYKELTIRFSFQVSIYIFKGSKSNKLLPISMVRLDSPGSCEQSLPP